VDTYLILKIIHIISVIILQPTLITDVKVRMCFKPDTSFLKDKHHFRCTFRWNSKDKSFLETPHIFITEVFMPELVLKQILKNLLFFV